MPPEKLQYFNEQEEYKAPPTYWLRCLIVP